MKKVIVGVVLVFVFCSTLLIRVSADEAHVQEAGQNGDLSAPEQVIEEYFSSMGNDWDRFSEFYEDAQVDGLKMFLNDADNIAKKKGVLNVKEALLKEIVEINYDDAVSMLVGSDYSDKDIRIFAVGVNFLVNEDTKYFSNGVCYYLLVLVNENDDWKVSELLQIGDPEVLRDKGYIFSDDYFVTEDMMAARQAGYLMNGEGEIFADIEGRSVDGIAVPYAVINQRYVPTDSTTIVYGIYTADGTTYMGESTLNFHQYCLSVSAGEVREYAFDGEARRARQTHE